MFLVSRKMLVVIITFVFLVVFSAAAKPRRVQRTVAGRWGGEHISIDVGARSASVEYDCAAGTIDGPFAVNSKGEFKLRGVYSRQHGGPVRRDEGPSGQRAIYGGSIQGNTMTLTVTLANDNESPGTFTLTRGSQGKVWKCR